MNKWIVVTTGIYIIIIGIFGVIGKASAEVGPISPEELADASDLIVIGTVNRIEESGEIVVNERTERNVNVKYALITVQEALKGKAISTVWVKFAFEPYLEADVQDPSFEVNDKVLLYLKSNNDKRKSYSVVEGWSGVGRFYNSKFYHQYYDIDFNKYVEELKKYINHNREHTPLAGWGITEMY
ncbi:MAG: hypothetical protein PHI59_00625 [Candidatus Omnitrophica bacterium]|nr:hypothetical protein [Candidatus Omnitrophota bacterium]